MKAKEEMERNYYDTPIGKIVITNSQTAITGLYLETALENIKNSSELLLESRKKSQLAMDAEKQLMEYFQLKRTEFDLPLEPKGTEFQRKVWSSLCTIPYGETRSYGDIAKMIGNPKSCRAVGGANNKNPIMIFIPCHRVIGANGSLVGFGAGMNVKKYLLTLEEQEVLGCNTDQTNMGKKYRY